MNDITKTLSERSRTHGDFARHSALSQRLCYAMRDHDSPAWYKLSSAQREALEMIQHKIARILNGNPDHHDHWHDISGYATLVAKDLK